MSGGRRIPVRLCDVRRDVLWRAALEAARRESDRRQADLILHAALCPSDRVYWVDAGARPLVDRIAA